MTVIFDGKIFARVKVEYLRNKVYALNKNGIRPKLVSILVGDDSASRLYVNLKKKVGEEIGAEVDIRALKSEIGKDEIVKLVKSLNNDKSVHGIVIQLPLPKNYGVADRDEIISSIAKEKDVDGLRDDSNFLTPVVKAVIEILKESSVYFPSDRPAKIVVVGAKGFEGRKIFRVLKDMDYDAKGLDKSTSNLSSKIKKADVLISVTGSPRIIGENDVRKGAVIIDVGSPKGDVKTKAMYGKVSFLSPVPGGVGPVTVASLLENLIESAS